MWRRGKKREEREEGEERRERERGAARVGGGGLAKREKEREKEFAQSLGAGTARIYLPIYLHLRSPKVATYVVRFIGSCFCVYLTRGVYRLHIHTSTCVYTLRTYVRVCLCVRARVKRTGKRNVAMETTMATLNQYARWDVGSNRDDVDLKPTWSYRPRATPPFSLRRFFLSSLYTSLLFFLSSFLVSLLFTLFRFVYSVAGG